MTYCCGEEICEYKEIVEKIQKRIEEINLDIDDTVDCHKIAKFVKELLATKEGNCRND